MIYKDNNYWLPSGVTSINQSYTCFLTYSINTSCNGAFTDWVKIFSVVTHYFCLLFHIFFAHAFKLLLIQLQSYFTYFCELKNSVTGRQPLRKVVLVASSSLC